MKKSINLILVLGLLFTVSFYTIALDVRADRLVEEDYIGNSEVIEGGSGNNTIIEGGRGGQYSSDRSTSKDLFTLSNPLKVESIGGLVQAFLEIFTYIVILFAVLMFVWVGLQFILAQGNSDRIKELKKQLTWLVVGVAIVIGARIMVQIVINTLQATGTISPGVIQSAEKAIQGR